MATTILYILVYNIAGILVNSPNIYNIQYNDIPFKALKKNVAPTGINAFSLNIFSPNLAAKTHIIKLVKAFIPNPLKKYTSCKSPDTEPKIAASIGPLIIENIHTNVNKRLG